MIKINLDELDDFKEGQKIPYIQSDCCNADVLYTENSGVYICPGIYCSKCKELL